MMATTHESKTVSERIEGPIPEMDKYGTYTGHDYFRCRSCGREAMHRHDLADGRCGCGGDR